MGALETSAAVSQFPGVFLGEGTVVEEPCCIGKPPRGAAPGQLETHIGPDGTIRPFTTIYAGSRVGARFQTGQGTSIREDNVIGDDVRIGTNAVLEHGNRIGDRTRIHTGSFLELVTIGDDVFVGPNVTFADDPHPPCKRYEDCVRGAIVGDRARIGANATILPGVRIGAGAVVGAGSVVTRDVPEGAVVVGNPAHVVKAVADLVCTSGLLERPYADTEPRQGLLGGERGAAT